METLKFNRLQRAHSLIKMKATGTPGSLARRLGVSVRTAHRTIEVLREMGAPVVYDKDRCSYIYKDDDVLLSELLDIRE